MYEQDTIFGPLSFKQFIILAIGFGLSYLLYNQVPQYPSLQIYIYIAIAFIASVSLYVAFSIFKNKKIPIERLEDYFKKKQLRMTPEKYNKMIKQKMAMIQSETAMRKEKGLPVDDSFAAVFEILVNLLQGVDFPAIDIS